MEQLVALETYREVERQQDKKAESQQRGHRLRNVNPSPVELESLDSTRRLLFGSVQTLTLRRGWERNLTAIGGSPCAAPRLLITGGE